METDFYRLIALDVSPEIADSVAKALATFTQKEKEVFYLWLSGYTHKEIMEKVNISDRNIYRVLATLRGKI